MRTEHTRDDDCLDLSPLDPLADTVLFTATISRLQRAAALALRRRRAATGVWGYLGRWRAPVYLASGLLAASSLVVLLCSCCWWSSRRRPRWGGLRKVSASAPTGSPTRRLAT
jgi:hypothetical protein